MKCFLRVGSPKLSIFVRQLIFKTSTSEIETDKGKHASHSNYERCIRITKQTAFK